MKRFLLILFGVFLVVGALYWALAPLRHGELVQKPVYAALQGSWLKHRDAQAAIVEERPNGLLLVGVFDKKGRRVWFALNRIRDDGAIYIIPISAESGIGCETISLVAARYQVKTEVMSRLKSACVPLPSS